VRLLVDEGSASYPVTIDPIFTAAADSRIESDRGGASLGIVAGAGDVNGDGFDDVIVGAPGYDAGQSEEGAAFVFLGSADGSPASAAARLESDQASAQLGGSAAGAGDVNGDGFADAIAGATFYVTDDGRGQGVAFVFLGGAGGIGDGSPASASGRLASDESFGELGQAVAGAGDVNGDGFADVIVAGLDASGATGGSAFVFLGSAGGIPDGGPATAAARLGPDLPGASVPLSVAGAGDVNGDGFADVILGDPSYTSPQVSEGAAFVFLGSATGIPDGNFTTALAQLESDQARAQFGSSVAGAGDVNGDGYADIIVGASGFDAGQTNEGAAFVFLGSATGLPDGSPTTASAQLQSDQANAFLGGSVSGAGDVNGDGYADLIVAASGFHASPIGDGAAFLFLGNGAGLPVLARQRRSDGSGIPVQPWGLSHSSSGFAVELRAKHPEGTGRVRAELEACPPGLPFGDPGCATALTPAVAVGGALPEAAIAHTFTDLAPDALFRWRARVLHAPPTGPFPAHPSHGPWRRPFAQAAEGDVRTGTTTTTTTTTTSTTTTSTTTTSSTTTSTSSSTTTTTVPARRVGLCHRKRSGRGVELALPPRAVPAHLEHGDALGPCPPPDGVPRQARRLGPPDQDRRAGSAAPGPPAGAASSTSSASAPGRSAPGGRPSSRPMPPSGQSVRAPSAR
jgi:hypothetical protein